MPMLCPGLCVPSVVVVPSQPVPAVSFVLILLSTCFPSMSYNVVGVVPPLLLPIVYNGIPLLPVSVLVQQPCAWRKPVPTGRLIREERLVVVDCPRRRA